MRKDDLIEVLTEGQLGLKAEPGGDGKVKHDGGDVIDLLIADHEKVKTLFKQVLHSNADDARLKQLAKQITAELTLHAEAEETIFYPALKQKALSANENDAKDEVLEAYVEHGSVKELIAQLAALKPADESYGAILQVMSEQVEHHIEEEETEIFKQL
jgi:iron-sulfur cluster repair protein YtfE (RIC family)